MNESVATARRTRLRNAYAVQVFRDIFVREKLQTTRIRELVKTGPGLATRVVEVALDLPAMEGEDPTLSPPPPSDEYWIVPLWVMRDGHLLTNLAVESADHKTWILGRGESLELTAQFLRSEWDEILSAIGSSSSNSPNEAGLRDAEADFRVIARAGGIDRIRATTRLLEFAKEHTPHDKIDTLKRFAASATLVTENYVLWIVTSARPGQTLRYTYSYQTRFAPEYTSDPHRWHPKRIYGAVKRWVGQSPSIIELPISRYRYATSYHVMAEAPRDCFFASFEFADATQRGLDTRTFRERTSDNGSLVLGHEDAGGPIGHLYAHGLKPGPSERLAVRAQVMERPPGALGGVTWLVTVTLFLSTLLLLNWPSLISNGTYLLTTLSIALTLLAAWYGHNFAVEGSARIPMAARSALWLVWISGAATIYAAVSNLTPPIGAENSLWELSQLSYGIVVGLLAAGVVLAWQQRVRFYREYRKHQRRIREKYGA